ncbi:hypothetical protein BU15DRAFT_49655 [Melanogaster broomeanus]|nr:hypothetical protein BU15DRAFT_49655 [Melanogaster broomeanus]
MKFITLITALATVLPAVLGQLTINTPPNAVECEPTMFTWSGGTAPYYLALLPGGTNACSPFYALQLKQFPTQTSTSYSWLVDIQANVGFTISLKDSTGLTAFSDIVTVQPGSDTSCVNAAVQEGGSTTASVAATPVAPASSAGTPAAPGTSAAAGTTAAAATHSSGSSTSPSATGSAVTASKSNAASHLSLSSTFGVAGVMGLVGAALF